MNLFPLIAALLLPSPQPVPVNPKPEPIPPKVVRIVPEKINGKPGKLLVIDAKNAKGDVTWKYDSRVFDKESAEIDGKKLRLVLPPIGDTEQTITIILVSWDDKAYEEVTITIAGTDGPTPPDSTDPIGKLNAKMDALAKAVADAFAKTDKRLTALENIKPIPPPADSFVAALQDAYDKDGKPAVKLAALTAVYRQSGVVVNDPARKKLAEIQTAMHNAASQVLGEPDPSKVTILPNVRRVLAAEFVANIGGKTGDVLTEQARKTITAEFLKAQQGLEKVQP